VGLTPTLTTCLASARLVDRVVVDPPDVIAPPSQPPQTKIDPSPDKPRLEDCLARMLSRIGTNNLKSAEVVVECVPGDPRNYLRGSKPHRGLSDKSYYTRTLIGDLLHLLVALTLQLFYRSGLVYERVFSGMVKSSLASL
jgi:hypothetical protein